MGRRVRRNLVGKARALFGTNQTDHLSNLLGVWPKWGPWLVVSLASLTDALDLSGAAWSKIRASATTGHTDPFGGAQAGRLVEDGTLANTHYLLHNTAGNGWAIGPLDSFNVYAKADQRGFARARFTPLASEGIWNLTSGACTVATGTPNVPATAVGGGWWLLPFAPTGVINPGTRSLLLDASTDGTAAGCSYNGVLGQGAVYFYKPTPVQTSIVTVPNLHASIALRDFANRLDLTNPAKASEPIRRLTDWAGRECAEFYAANFLSVDALAPIVSGQDTLFQLATAGEYSTKLGIQDIWSLGGNAGGSRPYMIHQKINGLLTQIFYRCDDTGATVGLPLVALVPLARAVYVDLFDGTQARAYLNGARDAATPGALDVGQCTFLYATLGGLRYAAGPTFGQGFNGKEKLEIIGRQSVALSEVHAGRLSQLTRAYAGGIA